MAFPESLLPYRALHGSRLRPLHTRTEPEEPLVTGEVSAPVWPLIFGVGGICWLIVTGTALLWMLPSSGTRSGDTTFVSTTARALQHLLVFLIATGGYRAALAWGWPRRRWAQARVVLANTLVALAVVSCAPSALAITAALIDGDTSEWHALVHESWHAPSWEHWTMPLRFFLPPYILGLCATALVLVSRRHHAEALRAAQLSSEWSDARMAMLSAQLQPHFLFNALHAISVLIDENPRQAGAVLARLGDFLRHALESSHWPWVDVATELAGLEAYLAVQQARFGDGLHILIDAAPETLNASLPALLLQPLAENAIVHGRDDSGATLRVAVAISAVGERLCVAVSNSSPHLKCDLSAADYGHGLANVELRLRAAYGNDAHLLVGPDPRGGTTAFLNLPLRDFISTGARRRRAS